MTAFVEALVAPKIHPLPLNEDQEEQKMMMIKHMVGDKNHVDDKALKPDSAVDLHPKFCLVNQPDKDKGGEETPTRKQPSLDRLKIAVATEMCREKEVRMVSISISCPGRSEIVLSQPFTSSPKASLFTLKEGTKYRLSFSFVVSNKDVFGLKYENTLWKAGFRVDRTTVALGNYSPQEKPYVFQLEEDTVPSGILVRGLYSARSKVIDNGGKCYVDTQYYFNIQKNWP